MKVYFDTNVVLDVLMAQEEYLADSAACLRLCGTRITGCLAVSQATDIFYILHKRGATRQTAKDALQNLSKSLRIEDINATDMKLALQSDMQDFEDALLAFCAKRHRANYIITRNVKDFATAPIPAVTPHDFLKRINQEV